MTAGMIPSRTSEKPKTASGGRYGYVGARDETAPAAERVAVHPRDDRRRAGVDRLAHLVQAHRVFDVLVIGEVDGRALPLDVGAGAEALALAGEDDDAGVPDQRERLGQLPDQRGVEGVAPLRLGQRHAVDRAVALGAESRHGRQHRVAACRGERSQPRRRR